MVSYGSIVGGKRPVNPEWGLPNRMCRGERHVCNTAHCRRFLLRLARKPYRTVGNPRLFHAVMPPTTLTTFSNPALRRMLVEMLDR